MDQICHFGWTGHLLQEYQIIMQKRQSNLPFLFGKVFEFEVKKVILTIQVMKGRVPQKDSAES